MSVILNESLNHVLEGKEISFGDATDIFEESEKNPSELFKTAQTLCQINKGDVVSFSKKIFVNVVNLCKDTCSYCTYKAEPYQDKVSMLSKKDVKDILKLGKRYRCVEALFITGERPEDRYPNVRKWLKTNGFQSTPEFLIHLSEMALDQGLYPHTNAGNLSRGEMQQLAKTNSSMGIMLENSSERLGDVGMPHHLAPSKRPKERLRVLRDSGELGIPMTTGILLGIGETAHEAIKSLFDIREIHKKYKNIQEIIIQNFQPKPDTKMYDIPAAKENYFKCIVSMARVIMPGINIQIPPNLSPDSFQSFLKIGINDWGGISPLTPDYVNPEFKWPDIQKVQRDSKDLGFNLKCRFPVYPEFFSFVNENIMDKIKEIKDKTGYVKEEYWRDE